MKVIDFLNFEGTLGMHDGEKAISGKYDDRVKDFSGVLLDHAEKRRMLVATGSIQHFATQNKAHQNHHQALIPITGVGYMNLAFHSVQSRTILSINLSALRSFVIVLSKFS